MRVDRRVHQRHHAEEHNAEYWTEANRKKASRAIRKALRELRKDPDWQEAFVESQRRRAREFWDSPKHADGRRQHRLALIEAWKNHKLRDKQAKSRKAFWGSEEGKRVIAARVMPKRKPLRRSLVLSALLAAGSVKGATRIINAQLKGMRITHRVISGQYPNLIKRLRREGELPTNHKVIRVAKLKQRQDVYCLTSPETGNFALEAGVFVKNCGIVVNVTPFEPEWEGFVTLEFSNTTPLPAKIYANEGCAQVLFFEGAEGCEVSYKDRNGKYQGQTGVTLPKA